MEPKKLVNWTAKRSGAAMTIVGNEVASGHQVSVAGVEKIEGGFAGAPAIATDKHGVRYELA